MNLHGAALTKLLSDQLKITQQAVTCSKSIMETPEQYVLLT